MRFIETKTHGYLDYLVGLLLMTAPWLLGFSNGTAETWVPVILGGSTIMYSLFTDYELGLSRQLPMSVHLTLDFFGGLLLAVSPWIFGFVDTVWLPHLALGLFEVAAAMFTRTSPRRHRAHYFQRAARAH